MDIVAHTLWAGIGVTLARSRWPIAPKIVALTMALAALPDLAHALPLLGWWLFGKGSLAALWAYAVAVPNHEPALPPLVDLLSHHLHCIMHSALVAGAVTALLWAALRTFWIPLLGWWSHIIIDVFTHSKDFYPAPVFYPITERAFNGVAWNQPWMLALNYAALVVAGLCVWHGRRQRAI
jgi:LexA-binding, inner membrane-associated putative hydrolase